MKEENQYKEGNIYFCYKKTKAKSPLRDRNYTSDDISVFTQATQGTQGTHETRIGEIETKVDQYILWFEMYNIVYCK